MGRGRICVCVSVNEYIIWCIGWQWVCVCMWCVYVCVHILEHHLQHYMPSAQYQHGISMTSA